MSYPAFMEKFNTGDPVGGADMLGAEGGGGPMEGGRRGKEEEVGGGKGEVLVKGEGNWEDWEGCVAKGLLKVGMEGTGGRFVETEGELMEMELMPGRDGGLDRPMVIGGAPSVAATVRGGVGLAGGVVSIPLSSIIVLPLYNLLAGLAQHTDEYTTVPL